MTEVWSGYFADPFVLRLPEGGYAAYGSGPPATSPPSGPRVFECLVYRRDRVMYGRRYDWHTLEGPTVVHRHGHYWMTYSGGAWTGPDYAVSWATASHPLGPWSHAPAGSPPLLATGGKLIGPGHNSLTIAPSGEDLIAYHSWDGSRANRTMHIARISFETGCPRVLDPLADGR